MSDVAQPQRKTSLTRTLRVGEGLSIDNGRVVIRVESIDRRRLTANFQLSPDVVVDKPPKKSPG